MSLPYRCHGWEVTVKECPKECRFYDGFGLLGNGCNGITVLTCIRVVWWRNANVCVQSS
jgi:hypothetical protein